MKIRRHLGTILLATCLSQALAISATATDAQPTNPNANISMVSKDDLSAQKELLQVQLDSKKELLQKDIDAQAKRIDAFEKRIDDQNSRIGDIGSNVTWFGIIAGILGILITVLLVGIGIWGYKAARNDAKETAKEAASQWFETNHNKLLLQMDELESRVANASQSIDEHKEKFVQNTNAAHAEIEISKDKVKADIEILQRQLSQSYTVEKLENLTSGNAPDVKKSAEQLKQKPESEYTFTDWNTRAFAAYNEGKLDNAIFYWDKASCSNDIELEDLAQTLLNKGITLGQLNRNEVEIAVYDALITQFGTATELDLQEKVAQAMVNKGITLGQLNRSEEAIAAFDALITQFGAAEELALREIVADALNGKGFNLLCMGKANWENTLQANDLFSKASDACKLAISKYVGNGFAHGNLAYISWLQGDAVAAEQHFRTGLAATKNGGETLYNGTLKDFDIHPIEPDQGFRELIEKLWGEYQQAA